MVHGGAIEVICGNNFNSSKDGRHDWFERPWNNKKHIRQSLITGKREQIEKEANGILEKIH